MSSTRELTSRMPKTWRRYDDGVAPVVPISFGEPLVAPTNVRAKAGEPRQPVRGRDDDLATIGRHLDRLLSGIGWVIVVEAAAGRGKSRLLQEVATTARLRSIRVGSGAADPADNVVQLAPLLEALFDGP